MAGTFTAKVLAQGQLTTTAKTTIYTVPGSTVAYLHCLNVFNDNAAENTIIFTVNPNGTSRKIIQCVLAQNESAQLIDHVIHLEAGDLVELDPSSATAIDYVLTGVEET